jgi:RNA-directed DNA polymerase
VIAKAKHAQETDKVRQLQINLYRNAKANPTRKYHSLHDKICSLIVLRQAWRNVAGNAGTAGIDRQTIDDIQENIGVKEFLDTIQRQLTEQTYKPLPVRRVYIPKGIEGEQRPLGIPCVIDRVVQAAVKIIIEPIFEADFLNTSWGFRPKRGAHDALEVIRREINQGKIWVLDADIRKYFDSINHNKLMVLVRQRVIDRKVLWLIKQWLKSGVLENGVVGATEQGTPQGGVISPLLANIYLHLLDKIWTKHCSKYGTLVRYADDFVVMCPSEEAANKAVEVVGKILCRMDLTMHPDKTRIVNLGDEKHSSFTFLGFEIGKRASITWKGKWYAHRWIGKRAMVKVRKRIREITRYGMNLQAELQEVIRVLNQYLGGWVAYYRRGNTPNQLRSIEQYVRERLMLWMSRKHQWRHRKQTMFSTSFMVKLNVIRLTGRVEWYKSKWVS